MHESRPAHPQQSERLLTLDTQETYTLLVQARRRQQTDGFKTEYGLRLGVESLMSQVVRACDIRCTRYLGQARTHLQHVLTAVAISLVGLVDEFRDPQPVLARGSAFARLAVTGEGFASRVDVSCSKEGMMTALVLADKARLYLQRLCRDIPKRRIGSHGNQLATDFFADTVAGFGFPTTCPPFNCMDWRSDGARLSVNGIAFPASVSPYSLGCHVQGPLLAVATIDELEAVQARLSVLLAREGLTKEPLMPKHFPFYNPDEHQRIIRALEAKQPLAIIAATARCPELAGALYPFPWIEDGDLDIPSVYMTDDEGAQLAAYAGHEVTLDIRAQRIPATSCNVIARKGTDATSRLVVCAHIDAKEGTPGALDNASGIVVLLLLAELLADYRGKLGIELVALNGEDHYANPGEQQYLQMNAGKFDEIVLGINLDGAGYCHGDTAYSLYACPPELDGIIHHVFSAQPTMLEGEPWYQGDHSLFLMQQRPALALTSEQSIELLSTIVHTPQDSPELIDSAKLVASAYALYDLVVQLDQAKRTQL